MSITPYGWLMLAGVALTACFWIAAARNDRRLPVIFISALAGALVGAKLVYLLAEGWHDLGRPDTWHRLAAGKTVLGGLLGGYAGVEIAKKLAGYPAPTGDRFAILAPLGLAFGRIGCWLQGCCAGRICEPAWWTRRDASGADRWPAVPVELAFNVAALAGVLLLRSRGQFQGQRFHLYLVAYGGFRFFHEFLRDTPGVVGPFSGYHAAALAVIALGALGWARRARHPHPAATSVP